MPGRTWIDNEVIAAIPKIGATAYAVFGVLARNASANGFINPRFSTLRHLEKACALSRQALVEALKTLEKHLPDHLRISRQRGKPNRYQIILRGQRPADQAKSQLSLPLPEDPGLVGKSNRTGLKIEPPVVGKSNHPWSKNRTTKDLDVRVLGRLESSGRKAAAADLSAGARAHTRAAAAAASLIDFSDLEHHPSQEEVSQLLAEGWTPQEIRLATEVVSMRLAEVGSRCRQPSNWARYLTLRKNGQVSILQELRLGPASKEPETSEVRRKEISEQTQARVARREALEKQRLEEEERERLLDAQFAALSPVEQQRIDSAIFEASEILRSARRRGKLEILVNQAILHDARRKHLQHRGD